MIERVARPLLGWVFVSSSVDVLRNPEPRAEAAAPVIDAMLGTVRVAGVDRVTAVRANAALQLAAGTTLSLGILPRLSAAALAGSLVPTTIGGHPFWKIEDRTRRAMQCTHFSKNLAILGGLLVEATRPRRRPPAE